MLIFLALNPPKVYYHGPYCILQDDVVQLPLGSFLQRRGFEGILVVGLGFRWVYGLGCRMISHINKFPDTFKFVCIISMCSEVRVVEADMICANCPQSFDPSTKLDIAVSSRL